MVNPSPPCRNVVFEVVSVFTCFAKLDICAISGINGVTTPMKKLAIWMYLMWCFVSQSRALIGNHIFQKRAAASMNHQSATESVLYACTIPVKSGKLFSHNWPVHVLPNMGWKVLGSKKC